MSEDDWKTLESAQSASRYFELARATPLGRFLTQIGPDAESHVIERLLRDVAARYAVEVAAFVPGRWRPAIAALGGLARLTVRAGLAAGGVAPSWAREDAALAAVEADPGALWLRRWRQLWPGADPATHELERLVARAQRALRADLSRQAGLASPRAALGRVLLLAFRGHVASPIAVVCHVGLTFIDIERLRGGLVRRRLFAAGEERAAS